MSDSVILGHLREVRRVQEPKMSTPDFMCAICDAAVFCVPATFDDVPICHMCRWLCSVEGRWHNGRDPSLPIKRYSGYGEWR